MKIKIDSADLVSMSAYNNVQHYMHEDQPEDMVARVIWKEMFLKVAEKVTTIVKSVYTTMTTSAFDLGIGFDIVSRKNSSQLEIRQVVSPPEQNQHSEWELMRAAMQLIIPYLFALDTTNEYKIKDDNRGYIFNDLSRVKDLFLHYGEEEYLIEINYPTYLKDLYFQKAKAISTCNLRDALAFDDKFKNISLEEFKTAFRLILVGPKVYKQVEFDSTKNTEFSL